MLGWSRGTPPDDYPEIRGARRIKAGPLHPFFISLILLIPLLGGCEGPTPRQAGIVHCNVSFSVAVYSWLIVSLVSLVHRKLGRDSMVSPQRLLLYQLGVAVVISACLSVVLFSIPCGTYWLFSKSPIVEWSSLQLASFLYLPFIIGYVLLAYLITLLPVARRCRPYSLSIAVVLHWLYCAHFFLVR